MEFVSLEKPLTISQDGVRGESQVLPFACREIIEIDASTEVLLSGLEGRTVHKLSGTKNTEPLARLGEAWRFRRTFERGRALMNAQDAWCLKAQAAAATGKLSILEGEDFPSEIELDVIVGIHKIKIALILQVCFGEMLEVSREPKKILIASECTLL